jgi:head-tail adaptor
MAKKQETKDPTAACAEKWEKARKLHARVVKAKAEHKATGEALREAKKDLDELFAGAAPKPAKSQLALVE